MPFDGTTTPFPKNSEAQKGVKVHRGKALKTKTLDKIPLSGKLHNRGMDLIEGKSPRFNFFF